MIFVSNEQRKTTDYQIKKASEYNKAHYIQIALRLSPEDAETVAKIATETRQSKNAVITTAIRLYAQSLTAADTANPGTPSPAPEEISPQSITGAETQHTETETETSPTELQERTQSDAKQTSPDIIGKATKEPTEDAQSRTEDDTAHTAPRTYTREELEEIAGRIAERAARKAYQRAIKEERARATAQRVRATARRVKAAGKIPAKIGKG